MNKWKFYAKGANSNMKIRQKLCREKGYKTKLVAEPTPGRSVLYVIKPHKPTEKTITKRLKSARAVHGIWKDLPPKTNKDDF